MKREYVCAEFEKVADTLLARFVFVHHRSLFRTLHSYVTCIHVIIHVLIIHAVIIHVLIIHVVIIHFLIHGSSTFYVFIHGSSA